MPKFEEGSRVRRIKTGNEYKILHTPPKAKQKENSTWVPAYFYRKLGDLDGEFYSQPAVAFESKFELSED